MSIITDIAKVHGSREKTDVNIFHRLAWLFRGTGEIFGFITSFLLFLVMGPFSVIAVIPALFSLCTTKQRMAMQEPESC